MKLIVAQSCQTLWEPMDCSPSGSSVYGILQARILVCIAMLSSRGSSRPRDQTCSFCITGRFFATEAPGKSEECVYHHKEKSGEGRSSLLCFWQVTMGTRSGKGKPGGVWHGSQMRAIRAGTRWSGTEKRGDEWLLTSPGHTDSMWQDWLKPYPLTLESILLTDLIKDVLIKKHFN